MFVLKSLGKYLLGNREQKEILQLQHGVFTKGSEGPKEGVPLTLSRQSTPHSYELVIGPLDNPKEQSHFKVDAKLGFTKAFDPKSQTVAFAWADGCKYVISGETSPSTVEMFQVTVAQCAWEAIHNKAHTNATDEELQALLATRIETQKPGEKEANKEEKMEESLGECTFENDQSKLYYYDAATGSFIPHVINPVKAAIYVSKEPAPLPPQRERGRGGRRPGGRAPPGRTLS